MPVLLIRSLETTPMCLGYWKRFTRWWEVCWRWWEWVNWLKVMGGVHNMTRGVPNVMWGTLEMFWRVTPYWEGSNLTPEQIFSKVTRLRSKFSAPGLGYFCIFPNNGGNPTPEQISAPGSGYFSKSEKLLRTRVTYQKSGFLKMVLLSRF